MEFILILIKKIVIIIQKIRFSIFPKYWQSRVKVFIKKNIILVVGH